MSLIGFKPTNHPQQVGKRGATGRAAAEMLQAGQDAQNRAVYP